MTYESAFQWVIDNIDISEYDNYDDYYDTIEDKIQTPSLTDNRDFEQMAIDYWEANKEPIEQPIDYIPERKEPIIESGYVVTPKGITPAVVVDSKPHVTTEPRIIIEKSGATGQPVSRLSFRQRLADIGSAISGFFRRGRK